MNLRRILRFLFSVFIMCLISLITHFVILEIEAATPAFIPIPSLDGGKLCDNICQVLFGKWGQAKIDDSIDITFFPLGVVVWVALLITFVATLILLAETFSQWIFP